MKNSTRVGIVICLAILLAFSLSAAFAGNEKTNATKNMTNVTKNMTSVTKNITNVTKNMTNATNPFAKVKGIFYKGVTLNSTFNTSNETHLLNSQPGSIPPRPSVRPSVPNYG